jgi:single-strand DNA-binding protein
MNLNKIFICGNLTRLPEMKALPSGMSVSSFSIATNRVWTDKQGQKQSDALFHNVVAFGKQAEILNQYCTKGSLLLAVL